MLKDITIGQYYPVKSAVHELDPRVKLLATFLYVISLFLCNNIFSYIIAVAFLLICIKASKVPFGYILGTLKAILFLMIITLIFNLFLTEGNVLWQWGKLTITDNGVRAASVMTARLALLIMGSSIMTLTTTPKELTDGLSKGLSPLKKIKVPVDEIAMTMSIALRFIPTLMEETDKIMKAQEARGASFNEGKIMDRIKALIPILVPLFVSALRRADELSVAMDARCYQSGGHRTAMKPLKYNKKDIYAYVVFFIYFLIIIALKYITKAGLIKLNIG